MSTSGNFGGQLESQWFHLLKREIRRQGGPPNLICCVFRDPNKVAQLATFLLTLQGKIAAPPADQDEPPLTAST